MDPRLWKTLTATGDVDATWPRDSEGRRRLHTGFCDLPRRTSRGKSQIHWLTSESRRADRGQQRRPLPLHTAAHIRFFVTPAAHLSITLRPRILPRNSDVSPGPVVWSSGRGADRSRAVRSSVAAMDNDLLDPKTWDRSIYIDGFTDGGAGDYAVVEPATGAELGRLGAASAGRRRPRPRGARGRAARRGPRALRRSGRRCCGGRATCSSEHADEIDGVDRPRGRRIPPKAGFETARRRRGVLRGGRRWRPRRTARCCAPRSRG